MKRLNAVVGENKRIRIADEALFDNALGVSILKLAAILVCCSFL
jgi:hypothetical protein